MKQKLAKISKATLNIQDRGILTFWIHVDYEEGCSQGVGGICLDTYDQGLKERVGSAYGCEVIRRLLLCLNVDDFSQMKGKHIWVLGEGDGFGFTPKGIKALKTDDKDHEEKAVIFDDILAMFK